MDSPQGNLQKFKQQANALLVTVEHNFDYSSLEDTRELVDPIEQYTTTGQPILDTTLEDILVSLRNTMHRDMLSFMTFFYGLSQTISFRRR